MISAISHLLDKKNLEDMFELYMKTRDMNVEFVTNYLRENTHLQNIKKLHDKVINSNIGQS